MTDRPIIGIDGEGAGRASGHRYRYLVGVNEDGSVATEERDPEGLSGIACLDALLRLPSEPLKFGYSLGYDLTFWLRDLPDALTWKLLRPDARRVGNHLPPVIWWPGSRGYQLNFVKGQLTVARLRFGEHEEGCRIVHTKSCGNPFCTGIDTPVPGAPFLFGCRRDPCPGCKVEASTCIWDVWRFFQGSFVSACENWGVVSEAEAKQIREFKKLRGTPEFEHRWDEVEAYCRLECQKLAELGRKLLRAHADAGLTLKSYFGSGSTGSVMLSSMNALDYMMRSKPDPAKPGKKLYTPIEYSKGLKQAIATAMFGGRFEIAQRGPVKRTVYHYDMASAYPYQFAQLPCLAHGKWRHVSGKRTLQEVERATAAVVRYRLPPSDAIRVDRTARVSLYPKDVEEHRVSTEPWGPFPLRHKDGTITFPVTSGGGWVWKSELLAGLRYAPNVQIVEAWVYNADCGCEVFRKSLPRFYEKRLEWGKNGAGLVLKFGMNACPGKMSQSRGFRMGMEREVGRRIWAGMVNAGTRADLLEAIRNDPYAVLATSTDGLFSTRKLMLREPVDLGTRETARRAEKAELGQWEAKDTLQKGVHLIRPGVLFALDGTKLTQTKARGIGKMTLKEQEPYVTQHWDEHGPESLTIEREVFWGARICVRSTDDGFSRDRKYGTWSVQKTEVSYEPTPKRPLATEDGRLLTWAFSDQVQSRAYDPAKIPLHVQQLRQDKDVYADQPDGLDEDEEGALIA